MPRYDDYQPGRHAGAYDPSTSIGRKILRIVLVIVALFVLSWPVLETFLLETEEVTLLGADLPASAGQLRIVYVSDIHQGGLYTSKRTSALISHINACGADLVLLGGDYAQDSNSAVEFFRQLPAIHARYGVYAVLGNHDRTIPEANMTTLRAAMQSAGVTLLVNETVRVRVGSDAIYIAGIDDYGNGRPDVRRVAAQMDADDYVIFLSHSPAAIPESLKATDKNGMKGWFDLGLFGHTHGGQFALLGPMIKDDGIPKEYLKGWLRNNRTDMLISRGVGTSGLPLRLFCTPQIHLITVKAPR